MAAAFKLSEAMNTYEAALRILDAQQFTLAYRPGEREDDCGTWFARKDGHEFSAFNPASLLGLVSIWQHFGESWRENTKHPRIYDRLMEQAAGE